MRTVRSAAISNSNASLRNTCVPGFHRSGGLSVYLRSDASLAGTNSSPFCPRGATKRELNFRPPTDNSARTIKTSRPGRARLNRTINDFALTNHAAVIADNGVAALWVGRVLQEQVVGISIVGKVEPQFPSRHDFGGSPVHGVSDGRKRF